MQNYYNLLYREEELETNPYCNHAGVGIIAWSPLARGRLARSFDSEKTEEVTTHREKHDPSTPILTLKTVADKEVRQSGEACQEEECKHGHDQHGLVFDEGRGKSYRWVGNCAKDRRGGGGREIGKCRLVDRKRD